MKSSGFANLMPFAAPNLLQVELAATVSYKNKAKYHTAHKSWQDSSFIKYHSYSGAT